MVNRRNYQRVCEYLDYLAQVSQLDPRSVERYRFYLRHLLLWADEVLLGEAASIRPGFPHFLSAVRAGDTDSLAPSTLKKIVQTVRRFFVWAKMNYAAEFREVTSAWLDALRPPRATQPFKEHAFVTIDEVRRILAAPIDPNDLPLVRDQAAVAMLYLSGMRATAFCTLPIAAVDLSSRSIKQWPSLGVATKNHKSATTYLLDIPDLLAVVEKWDATIRATLPATTPWYAPFLSRWGERTFSTDKIGQSRNVLLSKRICRLFRLAELDEQSPHKLRHGHAVYALQHAKTMADYKAVSMNLMHEDIRVTDGIYAPLLGDEVRQRIANLTAVSTTESTPSRDLTAFVNTLSKVQLSEALIAIAREMTK